jgi:cyclopropane-fatty-acyl-phospholipid synthase
MLLEKKITQWAALVREQLNIPARIKLWNGQQIDLGDFETPAVTLSAHSAAALPLLLDPNLNNLGEAYVQGKVDVEGKLADIIDIGYTLAAHSDTTTSAMQRAVRYFTHSKSSDKAAIQYHYDVSNEFYAQWLDPNMLYSCAYFEQGTEDLATAQLKKIDHILTKIDLRPNHTLLDIGCGWGSLLIRAAQQFGARGTGVTLSQNQYELATARVQAAGLSDRITIRLQDYRDVTGPFDRITSVGMFEHVGRKNLPGYFSHINQLLAEDGVVMNHGITSTDSEGGEVAHGGGEFIDRYVFPNGELPHISQALKAMQEGGLETFDVENLRRHYARTLHIWSEHYEAHSPAIREMVDDKTYRIWRLYLAGCAHAFEQDDIAIYQIVGRKAGRHANTLPWSRQYMYQTRR